MSVAGQREWSRSVIIRIMVRMTAARTTLIVALAAAVVTVAALWGVRATNHDRDWAHGGDGVTVSALVRLADKPAFGRAVAALGGPADQVAVEDSELVVQVRWSGPDNRIGGGHYEFVVLDGSGGPTLLPLNAWGTGVDGFEWRDAYQPLSTHYAWLAGTAFVPDGKGGGTNPAMATGVLAAPTGSVTMALRGTGLVGRQNPIGDLVIGVFYVRDAEVRWAAQAPYRAG